MKKLKVCIIFFFLVLYGVPVHAASYYTEGYFQYHLKDTYASICGYFGKEEVVRIPSALGGKPVKEIEDYSFQNAAGVQEIQIPATVLSIGDNAFTGAEELKRVEKDALENQKPEGEEGNGSGTEHPDDSNEGSYNSSDTQKPQDQLPGNNTSGQPEENAPGQEDNNMEQAGNTDQKEDPGQPDTVSPGADPEETKEPEKTTENDQMPESITETQQGQTSGDELKESQSSEEKTDTESGAAGNSAVQVADGESKTKDNGANNGASVSGTSGENPDLSEAEGEKNDGAKILASALRETPVGETDFSETGQELLPEEETEYIGDSTARKDTQKADLTPVLIICGVLVLAAGIGGAMYRLHKNTGRR